MPAIRRRYYMNDRAVQDDIIRYLADATVRTHTPDSAPISAGMAGKASQFAHFLARRYYRDRLARSFRNSRGLRAQTGRSAEEAADLPEFDQFLHTCVLGSLASAQRVGKMACAHLTANGPGPWWPELIEYEHAYFLQAATAEQRTSAVDRPWPSVSAVCRKFAWALPQMLPRLRAGGLIGDDLQHEATLLFSRTQAGRIYVVEVEPELERVFRSTDGRRTADQIAEAAGIPAEQAGAMLVSLASIGAVQFPI